MVKQNFKNRRGCAAGDRSGEQGQAMFVVLVVLAVVVSLGASLLAIATTERKISHRELLSAQAFFVAEGGINLVLANLREDPCWREGIPEMALGGGVLKGVSLTDLGSTVDLRSEAVAGEVTRTVTSRVEVSPLSAVIFARRGNAKDGSVEFKGNSEIEGRVVFPTGVDLKSPHTVIRGELYSKGNVIGQGRVVGKVRTEGSILVDVDGIKEYGPVTAWESVPARVSEYRGVEPRVEARGEDVDEGEDLQALIDGLPDKSGVVYIYGDVRLKKGGSIEGRVAVVVEGSAAIDKELVPAEGSVLVLVTGGDVHLGADFKGVVISGGTLSCAGNVDLEGSFMASEFDPGPGTSFRYDPSLASAVRAAGLLVGGDVIRMVDWGEGG